MARYEVENRDGALVAVSGDIEVKIGEMDDVVSAIGGETYTVTYDRQQRTQPWLDTDDGELEIDIRDTVSSLRFDDQVLEEFADAPMDTAKYGLPERTVKFAETVVDIWAAQGAADED